MLAGSKGVLGVYYILENIITANMKEGKSAVKGGTPRKHPAVIVASKFEETKGYSPGFFFRGPKKMC